MTAVIKFEYLIAPLICTEGHIDDHVNGMRLLKEMVSNADIDVKCEESIINNMIDAGYFPCTRVLSNAFPSGDECVHSAQDVAKLINNLIDEIDECPVELKSHDIEWGEFSTEPIIHTVSLARNEHVLSFLKTILSRKALLKEDFSMFYTQRSNKLSQSQNYYINGTVTDIFPNENIGLPLIISDKIKAYGSLYDFISNLDGYSLFSNATNLSSLKCALYCGCVNFLKKHYNQENIEWDDFKIGRDFYDSLIRNQCANAQEYSSVVYETIIQVLCRHPKNEVKPFRVSSNSTIQRTIGDLKAWRTHITSKHQALRLMFWVDSNRVITLANVGPKFEENISLP